VVRFPLSVIILKALNIILLSA